MRRGLLVALLLALVVGGLVVGCATQPQRAPEPVQPATPTARPAPDGTAAVRIFLVRDDRLVPVVRRARSSAEDALALLVAGPTPPETAAGLRTALPTQPDAVRAVGTHGGTMVVEVDVDVTRLPGRERLLAVAQVVWTATEALDVERVRFQLDGRPFPTPTDAGPTTRPVRRADVGSVAPG